MQGYCHMLLVFVVLVLNLVSWGEESLSSVSVSSPDITGR